VTVHWTRTALGHLAAIHGYIAQNSPRHAQGIVDRLTRRTEQLADFPRIGAMVSEYQDESIREVLEPPYRIIYRILAERIDVLAVVHGARRLPRTLPE
jgi:plasmid stabilization system protein ParE